MHHKNHAEFIAAFNGSTLVELTFLHKKDGNVQTRLVGPQDYGPNARSKDNEEVYWFLDVADGEPSHPFPKRAGEIVSMRNTNGTFARQYPAKYL
jgi:hypothetical protein